MILANLQRNQTGKVLHHNPATGVTTYWVEDTDGNWAIYEEQADVSSVMDFAAAKAAEGPKGLDLRHIGEIPMVFIDQAINEGWYNDPAAWRRFLSDNSRFKVHKW